MGREKGEKLCGFESKYWERYYIKMRIKSDGLYCKTYLNSHFLVFIESSKFFMSCCQSKVSTCRTSDMLLIYSFILWCRWLDFYSIDCLIDTFLLFSRLSVISCDTLFEGCFLGIFPLLNCQKAFLGVMSDYIFLSELNLLQLNEMQKSNWLICGLLLIYMQFLPGQKINIPS